MGMYIELSRESGMEGSWFDKREICSGEAALWNTLSVLPVEVWREVVPMDDKTYRITFERISPIYRRRHSQLFEHWADYRTALNYGTSYSNTYFCTLIWNVEKTVMRKRICRKQRQIAISPVAIRCGMRIYVY